ncbi:MAG: class I SAM-dependent methyltransferase [Parafilimonas terrae]|nr:class I SAM-dependent methyltransferase [Parafilimonas terrae]
MFRDALKLLEIRARTRAPNWVRHAYRSVRAVAPQSQSRWLPDDLVQDCRFLASRYAILDALPRQAKVVELGTLRGDFAAEILARTDPRELHLVDIDFSVLSEAVERDARVRCHRGMTHEVLGRFEDGSIDWIYVDADHTYAGALRDAEAAAAKVRPGGYLVFNDFAHVDPEMGRYGVHRAVVDFAIAARWPLRFFAYQPSALYDVALQKPVQGSSIL